jgi:hypothetical protein
MRRIVVLFLLLASTAGAQTRRGELALSAHVHGAGALPEPSWSLGGRLEASFPVAPLELAFVAEPRLRIAPRPRLELRVSEALVRYRAGDFEVSAGLERLPLETARLSLPYAVGAPPSGGVRSGVPGLRLRWFGERTRVRLAAFHADGGPAGAASLRRELERAEVEGHVVLSGDGAALGMSGSGLLGATVLYGEVWLLTGPLEPRAALGAAGVAGDVHWTLEAAYLAPPGGHGARPTVAAALAGRAAEQVDWRVVGNACFGQASAGAGSIRGSAPGGASTGTPSLTAHAAAAVTYRQQDRDVRIELSALLGPFGRRLGIGVETRAYL